MLVFFRYLLAIAVFNAFILSTNVFASSETAVRVEGQTCEYDCSSDGWAEPNCTSDGPCCPEIPIYCKRVKCTDPREQFPAACLTEPLGAVAVKDEAVELREP